MASNSPRLTVVESLHAEKIQITLKYGLNQTDREYSGTDTSRLIIERIYTDAEKWIHDILNTSKNSKPIGRFVINLYRISTADFDMVPIVQASDIEQNSLAEIVLVPVETDDDNPHCLYECQIHKTTYCSKCTRLILRHHKQVYRCSKCRMVFHKDCAPFLQDDCSNESKQTGKSTPSLTIINPFPLSSVSQSTTEHTQSLLPSSKEAPTEIKSNTIIDKGIFPACIRGAKFYGRYLFRLTQSTLSMSTDLSPKNVAQTELPATNKNHTVFSLADIQDLILTDRMENLDSIFEIHIRNHYIISVGKKTDSGGFGMETAQFYSSIREQRETFANATSSSNASPVINTRPTTTNPSPDSDHPRKLRGLQSNFRVGDAELHERYAFTGEKIGEGAFGQVVGAIKKATHEPRAIKIIEKGHCSEAEIKRVNDEAHHLYTFSHVNILKLEAYYERNDALYLVTERLETDMCNYILTSPNHYLEEDTTKMLIYQIIVALRYLHDKECSHLDIKCENILLTLLKPKPVGSNQNSRDFPLVKLADFGYSRTIGEHSFRKTRVGTPVYSPPEMYNSGAGYNRLADMWSAGVVMYAALSGTLPFTEDVYADTTKVDTQKKNIFIDARWASITDKALDLLDKHLLVVNINGRAKTNQVLFHDWFTDPQLYQDLREIERRTQHMMNEKNQQVTPARRWLTVQRSDPVWDAYRAQFG